MNRFGVPRAAGPARAAPLRHVQQRRESNGCGAARCRGGGELSKKGGKRRAAPRCSTFFLKGEVEELGTRGEVEPGKRMERERDE